MIARFAAEMAGTFAMVFIGIGSILLSEKSAFPSTWIPVVWGSVITAMIAVLGPVSGAHFNPVVTVAFALDKRILVSEIGPYWLGQLFGGLTAVGVLGIFRK